MTLYFMYSSATFSFFFLQYVLTFFPYTVFLENVASDSRRRGFSHCWVKIRQDRQTSPCQNLMNEWILFKRQWDKNSELQDIGIRPKVCLQSLLHFPLKITWSYNQILATLGAVLCFFFILFFFYKVLAVRTLLLLRRTDKELCGHNLVTIYNGWRDLTPLFIIWMVDINTPCSFLSWHTERHVLLPCLC